MNEIPIESGFYELDGKAWKRVSQYQFEREHIIKKYPVPQDIKRGTPVRRGQQQGKIAHFASGYIVVRFEGGKRSTPVHPLELAYNGEDDDAVKAREVEMQKRIDWFNRQLRGEEQG